MRFHGVIHRCFTGFIHRYSFQGKAGANVCSVPAVKWVGLCEVEHALREAGGDDLAVLFFKFHTDCFPAKVACRDKG